MDPGFSNAGSTSQVPTTSPSNTFFIMPCASRITNGFKAAGAVFQVGEASWGKKEVARTMGPATS